MFVGDACIRYKHKGTEQTHEIAYSRHHPWDSAAAFEIGADVFDEDANINTDNSHQCDVYSYGCVIKAFEM